jgi:hypothetical protein
MDVVSFTFDTHQIKGMLLDDGLFEKQLPQTFHFNVTTCRRTSPKDCKPHHPVSFYDRHLDTNLVLKHVEINLSIPKLLYQLYKKEVKGFIDAGHSLSRDAFSPFKAFELIDDSESTETGYHYESNVCYSMTSRILFHPNYPSRKSVFYFAIKSVEGPGTKFLAEGSLTVQNRVTNPRDEAKLDPFLDALDESAMCRLKDLEMQIAGLATWEMYAMTSPAHKLLKSMQTSHVRGVPADLRSLQVPSDANSEFLPKIHRGHEQKTTRL